MTVAILLDVCNTLLQTMWPFGCRRTWKQATLLHDGLWRASETPRFEDILCDGGRVDAILLIHGFRVLRSGSPLGRLRANQELRGLVRTWLGKVTDNVYPFLVPAENSRADLIPGKRSNGFLEHARCPANVERLGLQGMLTALQGLNHVFEEREHEFGPVIIKVNEESTVRLVQIVIDIKERSVRGRDNWSKESLAAMLGTLYCELRASK